MRIPYRNSDVELLGRIMRAEALGEGKFGMKLVGNIIVNRVCAECRPFRNLNTVRQVVYKKNAFEGTTSPLFQARANGQEKRLAIDCLKYWRAHPAYKSLYFYAPGRGKKCKSYFWGTFVGKYRNHCFYVTENVAKCNL